MSPETRNLFTMTPKQQYAHALLLGPNAQADQVLYGGSAGGGKSGLVRIVACDVANRWPGSDFAIFRRTDRELKADHIEKWLEDIDPFVPGGRFFAQAMEYHWPAPPWCWDAKDAPCPHSSKTLFLHVDDARGEKKHQGAEHAGQGVDEGGHFRGDQIDYLFTRVRAPRGRREKRVIVGPDGEDYKYPGWPDWHRLQVITANPGDVGHQYMLDTFIEPVEGLDRGMTESIKRIVEPPEPLMDAGGRTRWLETIKDPLDLGGPDRKMAVDLDGGQSWSVEITLPPPLNETVQLRRAFIPARVQDNPHLDPLEYAASLAAGSEENLKRLLEGDWSFFEGKVFKTLNPTIHLVDADHIFGEGYEVPPEDWDRDIGYDHGLISAGEWITRDREGNYIFYMEYYGEGDIDDHAEGMKDRLSRDGHPDLIPIGDPQMWRKNQYGKSTTYSIADAYKWLGEPPESPTEEFPGILFRKKLVERETGRQAFLRLLKPQDDRPFPDWHQMSGQLGSPRLFIARQCPNLWRELNNIRYKEHDPAGDTVKEDDHGFDGGWRALVVFERGFIKPRGRVARRVISSSVRTANRDQVSTRGRQVVAARR